MRLIFLNCSLEASCVILSINLVHPSSVGVALKDADRRAISGSTEAEVKEFDCYNKVAVSFAISNFTLALQLRNEVCTFEGANKLPYILY